MGTVTKREADRTIDSRTDHKVSEYDHILHQAGNLKQCIDNFKMITSDVHILINVAGLNIEFTRGMPPSQVGEPTPLNFLPQKYLR